MSNLINFHQGVPEMSSMGSACQKCHGNSHFLNSRYTHIHTHNFRFPEIDMTSILESLPACFLEAHQRGSEDQYFYPTGHISDAVFQKL